VRLIFKQMGIFYKIFPKKIKNRIRNLSIVSAVFCLFSCQLVTGYEIFVFRPSQEKTPLFPGGKLRIHGEFFGQLQHPSTFPSYNDLSGKEDRWNFGFRNLIFITENASFLAQLVTHDDGNKRTKFDWHFSFRYHPIENLAFILGHDSNHDSDYQSTLNGSPYFLNRNCFGFGLPFRQGPFYIEPFTWFLYHTNQRGHLDLSGDELIQEYGIRMGAWWEDRLGLSLQFIGQSEVFFSLGQAFLVDCLLRVKLSDYLELSLGVSLWKDMQESRLGNNQKFHKIIWGVAVPF